MGHSMAWSWSVSGQPSWYAVALGTSWAWATASVTNGRSWAQCRGAGDSPVAISVKMARIARRRACARFSAAVALLGWDDADGPLQQPLVSRDVVVSGRAFGVVDGVGEVERELPRHGLTSTGERGPLQVTSWAPLLLAGCVLAVLVRHLRRAADPLLPLRLLRSRAAAGANLTALALTATTTPAMYLATLYVQQVLRLSPARASLLFPVFNLAVIAGSLTGPAALRRVGARRTLLAGFAAVAAGTALFASLPVASLPGHGRPIGQLLAAFAVMGAGLGGASVASTHAGAEAADPAYQGVASGVLTSASQIGTAFGVAILAPLATAAGSAVTGGYRTGFIGACALALAGLLTSLLLPPPRASARQDHQPAAALDRQPPLGHIQPSSCATGRLNVDGGRPAEPHVRRIG
jgi:hypothetical protein